METRYHKKFQIFIDTLDELFPEIPKIELFYRNFKIIEAIYNLEDCASIDELHYELGSTESSLRIKLRKLEDEKLVISEKIRKPSESYRKKYYSISRAIDQSCIGSFGEYCQCGKCGKSLGKVGGVVWINREADTPIRIFCTGRCRNEWCFDKKG